MPGSYCKFCDRRCFATRVVIVGGLVVWSGHMATCAEGTAFDRSKIGADYSTAYNPALHPHDEGHCRCWETGGDCCGCKKPAGYPLEVR